jgi:serine/threonine protein kinase
MSGGRRTYTFCGTNELIAPEVFNQSDGYDISVDWWGFGCLLFEMICGLSPFHSLNKQLVIENIISKSPLFPPQISPAAKDLILRLIEKDQKNRLIDPTKIKDHEFFAGIDWQQLKNKQIKAPFVPEVRTNFESKGEIKLEPPVFSNLADL